MLTGKQAMPAVLCKQDMLLMGNRFEITVVGHTDTWCKEMIAVGVNEIRRIERLLTTFNDGSETNQVNSAAGIAPVKVSEETFRLVQRSIRLSELTQGSFDITYGSVDKSLWNFDAGMTRLPDEKTAAPNKAGWDDTSRLKQEVERKFSLGK